MKATSVRTVSLVISVLHALTASGVMLRQGLVWKTLRTPNKSVRRSTSVRKALAAVIQIHSVSTQTWVNMHLLLFNCVIWSMEMYFEENTQPSFSIVNGAIFSHTSSYSFARIQTIFYSHASTVHGCGVVRQTWPTSAWRPAALPTKVIGFLWVGCLEVSSPSGDILYRCNVTFAAISVLNYCQTRPSLRQMNILSIWSATVKCSIKTSEVSTKYKLVCFD